MLPNFAITKAFVTRGAEPTQKNDLTHTGKTRGRILKSLTSK